MQRTILLFFGLFWMWEVSGISMSRDRTGYLAVTGHGAISYHKNRTDTLPPDPDITRYAISFLGGADSGCYHSQWHCLGPTGIPGGYTSSKGQGQIHVIAFSPDYETDSVMYAGSNFGGLWKRQGRHAWHVIGQGQLPYSSISDVAIDPANKNTLFVTTGDGENNPNHHAENTDDGSSSQFTPIFTAGVFRSRDGGLHWQSANGREEALLGFFREGGAIRKVRLSPRSPGMWIVSSEGIFYCPDREAPFPQWRKISGTGTTIERDRQLKGLELHPTHPDTLYASGLDIYRSTDGGAHWQSMTGPGTGLMLDSLSEGFEVDRINIGVTPAAPERLYAYIVGHSGHPEYYIYYYDGMKWHHLRHSTTYSAFELATPTRTAIGISPRNADTLFFGTTKVYGGDMHHIRGYSSYSGNGYHADVHTLVFSPDGKTLYAGTDGGISKKPVSRAGSSGWQFDSEGLQVKTIHRFGDAADRPDHIITGNQDNGTDVLIGKVWTTFEGGDGYNGKVDRVGGLGFGAGSGSSNRLMTYDFITKRQKNEWIKRLLPRDPSTGKLPLIKSFQMKNHPVTDRVWIPMTELYERKVHRPAKRNDTADSLWVLRSDIGKYIPARWKRQMTEYDICASDPDYIYLIVNGYQKDFKKGYVVQSHLFLSTTGGCDGIDGYRKDTCFKDLTGRLKASGIINRHYLPRVFRGDSLEIPALTSVVFDPENPLKAWITFTGYEPGIKVWKTEDGGDHWANADPEGSLSNLPVNDIVYQNGTEDMLYIGTDAGIYFKDKGMSRWKHMCDFPNVRVTELRIHYCMNKLRAATFGRGIWEGALAASPEDLGSVARTIGKKETWTQSRGLYRDIRIPSGHVLQISGTKEAPVTVSLPANGRIILEDDARLILQNVILTNGCDNAWQGLVWEQKDKMHPPKFRFEGVQLLNIR